MTHLTEKELMDDVNKKIAAVPAFFHNSLIVRQERLSICNTCEKKQKFLTIDQCGVCNCLIPFKVSFKGASCPLNKWVPVPPPTQQECTDNNISIRRY